MGIADGSAVRDPRSIPVDRLRLKREGALATDQDGTEHLPHRPIVSPYGPENATS